MYDVLCLTCINNWLGSPTESIAQGLQLPPPPLRLVPSAACDCRPPPVLVSNARKESLGDSPQAPVRGHEETRRGDPHQQSCTAARTRPGGPEPAPRESSHIPVS